MNVYEAMGFAAIQIGSNQEGIAKEAQKELARVANAWIALAPDWDDAPDDAKWYSIDCDGEAAWHNTEPSRHFELWDSQDRESIGYVVLHDGIDWRMCKWSRNAT